MRSAAERWLESLSPWPEEFGLERIRALLTALGEPQQAYPAIHVVGTNGKSTAVRSIEALLQAAGYAVGAYLSPHVRSWAERIRVRGSEAGLEQAVAQIRPVAEQIGTTQFEALTAAALAAFAAAQVDVAVVEAGLGGRLDATNVLDASVVVLTNVDLEHTDVLGPTREAIAAEKLAVARPGATVILGEPEWEGLALELGAGLVVHAADPTQLASAAAEVFAGRSLDPSPLRSLRLPGRLEQHGERPLELWDGAHNPHGVRYLLERLPRDDFVLVLSILASGKDVEEMLRLFAAKASRLVATESRNARALPAEELAGLAEALGCFVSVERLAEPAEAVSHARELAGSDGAVLVSGSLYLLQELWRSGAVRSGPVR